MLDEAGIIAQLQAAFGPAADGCGMGDDAAVLPLNEHESYVITKDILVEHRHFRLVTTDAVSLAHKALHVNLSDIAAMGARPLYVLMGIALPPATGSAWVEAFLSGFAAACRQADVRLIGGDTTASERDLFISVTAIGRAAKAHLKFRNGAKVGDVVCHIGLLGEAHVGLAILEANFSNPPSSVSPPSVPPASEGEARSLSPRLVAKSVHPTALVEEGAWLGAQSGVTAMMDVSDGLHIDLTRMMKASRVGVAVDVENVKISAALKEAAAALRLDALECALAGGEDYGLLFTVAGDAYEKLARDFEKKFGYALTKIGTVVGGDGVELRQGGKPMRFAFKPFSHFGEL